MRVTNAPIRKSELAQVEGMKKSRGRPKITLIEVIKMEMSIKGVIKSMTLDRVEWRKIIYMVDPVKNP